MKKYILVALCYGSMLLCSEKPKEFTISRSCRSFGQLIDFKTVLAGITTYSVTTLKNNATNLTHSEYTRVTAVRICQEINFFDATIPRVSAQEVPYTQEPSLKSIMERARKKYFQENPTDPHSPSINEETISFDRADLDKAE